MLDLRKPARAEVGGHVLERGTAAGSGRRRPSAPCSRPRGAGTRAGRVRSRSRGRWSSPRPARPARTRSGRRGRSRGPSSGPPRPSSGRRRRRGSRCRGGSRRGRRRRRRGRPAGRRARAAARATRRARRGGARYGTGSAYSSSVQPLACRRTSSVLTMRDERLGVLAGVAEDRAPVPERPPREEPLVGERVPAVRDDRARHVPALPPGPRGAVAEVDLLAVHAEARVVAAELVEHLAAEEERAAEHPVGLDRLGRVLVEVVVRALALLRREGAAERRAADERPADGREARAASAARCRRG